MVPSNDNQQHDPKSARTGSVWVDDCHARRVAALSAATAKPSLSSVRRPTRSVRHTELLERSLKSTLHSGRCCRLVAIATRRNNHRALFRDIFDGLWLVLL